MACVEILSQILSLVYFLGLFIVGIVIHELAHLIVMFIMFSKRYGIKNTLNNFVTSVEVSVFGRTFFKKFAKNNQPKDEQETPPQGYRPFSTLEHSIVALAGPLSHLLLSLLLLYCSSDWGVKFFVFWWCLLGIYNLFANNISPELLKQDCARDGKQMCVLMILSNPSLTAKLMIPSFWREDFKLFLQLPEENWSPYWKNIKNVCNSMTILEIKTLVTMYYLLLMCLFSVSIYACISFSSG